MTELAFIALGSNIEPEKNIPLAIERLAELGKVVAVSQVYQNPAVGPTRQADFLNAAALVESDLPPLRIRAHLRAIEADMGRVRSEDKYAPRTIDLDLCLLGDTILADPELKLPDPDILSRAHLAVTLAELNPEFPHPLTQVPLQAIANHLRCAGILSERPDVRAQITLPTQHLME